MSAFDILTFLKSFGGQADARAGSLTGDLSQRLKGVADRVVGTTSPGLSALAAGSLGQQVQWLVDNPAASPAGLANLGLGKAFPFTNGSVTDLVINGADQTVAPTNGVLRYRSITFTTAHVLRITSSPCILMVDTITWNAAGVIACEASGTPSLGADPAELFPRGGCMPFTGVAVGGYGGGFLLVLTSTVNGSTTGTIRANGMAGNRNTSSAATVGSRGGEGALSARMSYSNNSPNTGFAAVEQWLGGWPVSGTSATLGGSGGPSSPASLVLAPGGDSIAGNGDAGAGGGSGYGVNAAPGAGGGSGFGAGGGTRATGTVPAVLPALMSPNLPQILALLVQGCRGGGGGAAQIESAAGGANNGAGGGGGGCVALIVDTETQVSTLTAVGGAAAGGARAAAGGAGVTLRQVI